MQLSDESNVASQFDKRGQGFWQGNQFIGYQSGGTLSQLGYKRHSPYNKAPSLLINTPTGSITMKEVDHPILGIGHNEIKFMLPNKEYQFKSNKVLEIPMRSLYPKGQNGMRIPKVYTDKNKFIEANQSYQDSLYLHNVPSLYKENLATEEGAKDVVLNKALPVLKRILNRNNINLEDYVGEWDSENLKFPRPNQPIIFKPKMQQGGTTPEMSPEQQQEIVRRVRNLRKTIGYNKVQGVPLDGIALRHKLHVNKHLIKQEDQELLGAFDENQILELMNNIPDDDQPMYKKGGSIKGKSKMYPKCKCGCGGVSVKGGMKFSGGGELGKGGTQAVADYQIKLNKLGANLKVDGQWGVLTQKAYEKYKEAEIPFNGVLNPQINKKEGFGKSMVTSFPIKEYEEIISRDKTHLPLEQQFKLEFGKYGNFNNEKIKTIFDNSNRSNSRLFVKESQRVENIKNPVIKAQELSGLKTLFQNITNPEWIKKDYQRRTLQQKEAHKKQLEMASENQYKKQQIRNKALGLPDTFVFEGSVSADSVLAKQSQLSQVNDETVSQYDLQKKYLKRKGMKFQQGGTMEVLDSDGNSQMKIEGGERIFSRVATKKMLELNESKNYAELGKYICDELKAQDEREPQYVKE